MFEAWSIPLRKECRLRVFENRILRRVFGTKWDSNREWRRLHNDELNSFYRSPNVIRDIKSRRLRWAGHVTRMGKGRSAFKILTGTATGKENCIYYLGNMKGSYERALIRF